jgi:hypothetical protein
MWSWYLKSTLRDVLVMQPLPASAQCRHIPVLWTQNSAQTHSCLLPAFIWRTSGHSANFAIPRSCPPPINCSFPSYSYFFALLTSVQRVTWTLVFRASSRTVFLRFCSSAVRFGLSGLFWCRINFGNWIFGSCWVRLMDPAQFLCPYKTIQSVECDASPFARCSSGYGRAERPTGVSERSDCSCWHGVYSLEKLTASTVHMAFCFCT